MARVYERRCTQFQGGTLFSLPEQGADVTTAIPGGTVRAGQFDWGGFLPKSNGGVLSLVQHGWQPCVEGMAIN